MIARILHIAWAGGGGEPEPHLDLLPESWQVRRWSDANPPPGCDPLAAEKIPTPKRRALYYRALGLLAEGGVAIQHDVRPEAGWDQLASLAADYPAVSLLFGKVDDSLVAIPDGFDLSEYPGVVSPSEQTCDWVYFHRALSDGSMPFIVLPNKLVGFLQNHGTIATHKPE